MGMERNERIGKQKRKVAKLVESIEMKLVAFLQEPKNRRKIKSFEKNLLLIPIAP